jgi:RNA polymerase sigma-70 factor, ECF subfamily
MHGEKRRPQQQHAAFSLQEDSSQIATQEEITAEERGLIQRLKEGDETAFNHLVEQHHPSLLSLARRYVKSVSSAEEVVQETWMGVLRRLPFFEGRSSLKTWIVRILTHRAQNYALRDQRILPFSSLLGGLEEADASEVDLQPCAGGWNSLREDSYALPEECLLLVETHACLAKALQELPIRQRAVMVLSDIEGREPEEICTTLGLSPANQRVLLHRARSRVRQGLEKYFDGE